MFMLTKPAPKCSQGVCFVAECHPLTRDTIAAPTISCLEMTCRYEVGTYNAVYDISLFLTIKNDRLRLKFPGVVFMIKAH